MAGRTTTVKAVCPYCGQPLANASAVQRLQRVERERAREVEKLAKEQAAVLGQRQTEKLEAKMQSERDKLERERARLGETERRRVAREYALREKQVNAVADDLKKKNDDLQRRIEKLSAPARGDFNEDKVFNQLVGAFHADKITRVAKGAPGADILQEVRAREAGRAAGLIAYECKDVARWSNSFVAQLKHAGALHRTPYLVLVTNAFPAKKDGTVVYVDDGVIVTEERCLIVIAGILRAQIIEMQRARLGADAREQRTAALLHYVTSAEFKDNLNDVLATTAELEHLLAKERLDHTKVWTRRESLYQAISERISEVEEQLRVIVEEPPRPRRRQASKAG